MGKHTPILARVNWIKGYCDIKKHHLTHKPTVGAFVLFDAILLVSTMHEVHETYLYGMKGCMISRFQTLVHFYFRCVCVQVCTGSFICAEARGCPQILSL